MKETARMDSDGTVWVTSTSRNIILGTQTAEHPENYRLVDALVKAVRDLEGCYRTNAVLSLPWDVATELIDMAHTLSQVDANPESLDYDEDFCRRHGRTVSVRKLRTGYPTPREA